MFAAQAERRAMGSALTVFLWEQIYEGREYSRKVPVLRDAESVIRDQCDH
jgi:hypothetical protein